MRRYLVTLTLAVLLAGCQQPGGNSGPQSAAVRDDERLRFFEPEFSSVLDDVIDNLARACIHSASNDERLDACLRERFADAFDDSRQGRRACEFHRETAGFIGCVAIGNTLLEVRQRLSDDTPVPASFWREEDGMVDALTETIVDRGVEHCGVSGGAERLKACVMDWFEAEIDLPSSMARRCEDQQVDRDRYACFFEGIMVQYLQDHVARLGAIST